MVNTRVTRALYEHSPYNHRVRNVKHAHHEELHASRQTAMAVWITRHIGTMQCVYLFLLIAVLGFPALSMVWGPIVAVYVVWLSQVCIQLVMLPLLAVGQNVLNRHTELQSDEQYSTTLKMYHEMEEMYHHLRVQDDYLISLKEEIVRLHDDLRLLYKPTPIRRIKDTQ